MKLDHEIPEDALDLPVILRLPAAEFELKSSSLMLLAATQTEKMRGFDRMYWIRKLTLPPRLPVHVVRARLKRAAG